ncbi:DUF3489 domain-containing protein [Brevundimonas aveniformis]|uniref:DUF3489 domain-containing protein n=1 Tax=Brevundimonas aveniformis TaxID=370977 RepID=UPI001B7FED5A|nr:DUF3489 domain-containing protein [Brevundimonas aveniformis]
MTTQPEKTKSAQPKKAATAKATPPKATSPRKPAAAVPVETTAAAPTGKLGAVVELMRRAEGATVQQMSEATGWQAHSVRGAMSGALKRKHGLTITSEKGEAGRVYRIAGDQAA